MTMEILRGGWFPEAWDVPLALGMGVVITGLMGDYVAEWISQFIPSEWLNPTSELIIGLILFLLGGWIGGDFSMWIRLFSFGAFAVGIADLITVLLGMGAPTASMGGVRVIPSPHSSPTIRTLSQNPGSQNPGQQDLYSMLENEKRRGETLAYQKVYSAAAERAAQAKAAAERAQELSSLAARADQEAKQWAAEAQKKASNQMGTYK